jgi:ABC-type amino acid transport substrate-binding protein
MNVFTKGLRLIGFALLVGTAIFGTESPAQEDQPLSERKLIVGTKEAPPFAMKSPEGEWHGISIDLWRLIAEDLRLAYEWREVSLNELIEGVAEGGELDAGVAALTITAAREAMLDFSHPFYTTGLGIAVAPEADLLVVELLERLLSVTFLKVVIALLLLLLSVGILVWLFERKRNREQFGGGPLGGIGSGLWWSAVTMTTVGYGDKAPRTLGGRIVGLVWMFAAIIIISSFTAAITSALTARQFGSMVRGPNDLPNVRAAVVVDTTAESYLKGRSINHRVFPTPREALQALAVGQVDCFVYDAPILRYLVKEEFSTALEVLPNTFLRQDYGIALAPGSGMREPINQVLLRVIKDEGWQSILFGYLGKTE